MRVISLLSTLPLAALASSNFKVQTRFSNSSGLDALSSSNSSSSSTSSSSQTNSTGSSSTSNSTSNGLPYETPDISHFKPSKGAHVAGKYSAKLCTWLGENFHKLSSEKITEAFGQYYPEGSNPSLELLSQTYPPGIIPANLDVAAILESVGPDIDITQDSDYGLQGREAQHGPLGGLPAFCRVGGNIATSDVTKVLFEVWLPVASDPSIDLAPINATDYPTASTPIELAADGSYIKGPPEVTSGEAAPSSTRSSGASARSLDENLEERSSSDFSGKELLGDSTGWNGRLLWINNGGQRGFVPLTDLKQQLSRHHFAVAGSNAGHFSTAGGASWINGTQYYDTLLDWSSRASHVGKIASEEAINIFYGNQAGTRVSKKREHSSRKNAGGSGVNSPKSKNRLRAYMAGCSVGGKQSFGSATSYPDDFDGIIGGAPAFFFNRLNRGQVHTQVVHRKGIAKDGYFNITLLPGPIHQTILKQCDELDAVKDGVINDPTKCKPRFEEELLCGAVNSTFGGSKDTCLTQAQIDNLKTIYEPTILNGTFVYDQYFPGLESRVGSLTGAASKASQYTQLAILRYPQLDPNYDVYNNFTLETVLKGERDNPSGSNMDVTDLSPFLNAGKKFIHYHGLIDMTVSPAASIRYHDLAVKDSTPNLNGGKVSDGYRFFPIPGMSHCRDGDGSWHFGSITQNDAGNRPLKWDSKHDMILSLVAWVEHGEKPKEIIGGSYNSRSKVLPIAANSTGASDLKYLPTYFESNKYGIINTRKLCPYPQQAVYKGGPINGTKSYKSFECK